MVKYFRSKSVDGRRALVAYKLVEPGDGCELGVGALVWAGGRDVGGAGGKENGFIRSIKASPSASISGELASSVIIYRDYVTFLPYLVLRCSVADSRETRPQGISYDITAENTYVPSQKEDVIPAQLVLSLKMRHFYHRPLSIENPTYDTLCPSPFSATKAVVLAEVATDH